MICTCSTHCSNTCEPQHCPPGTRCECWCHENEDHFFEKKCIYCSKPISYIDWFRQKGGRISTVHKCIKKDES